MTVLLQRGDPRNRPLDLDDWNPGLLCVRLCGRSAYAPRGIGPGSRPGGHYIVVMVAVEEVV
jgi:hypothetical protein